MGRYLRDRGQPDIKSNHNRGFTMFSDFPSTPTNLLSHVYLLSALTSPLHFVKVIFEVQPPHKALGLFPGMDGIIVRVRGTVLYNRMSMNLRVACRAVRSRVVANQNATR